MFLVKDDLGHIVKAIKIISKDNENTLLEVKNENGIGWKKDVLNTTLKADKYYWYVPTKNLMETNLTIEIE